MLQSGVKTGAHLPLRSSIGCKLQSYPLVLFRRAVSRLKSRLSPSHRQFVVAGTTLSLTGCPEEEVSMLRNGKYFEFARFTLERTLTSSDVILQTGCRFGFLTAVAAHRIGAENSLIAYEWRSRYHEALLELSESLPLTIQIHKLGLVNTSGTFPVSHSRIQNFWEDVWEDDFQLYDVAFNIEAIGLKEARDAFSTAPSYLLCELDTVSKEIFCDSETIDTFKKILLIASPDAIIEHNAHTIFSDLISRGWALTLWPRGCYFFQRQESQREQ